MRRWQRRAQQATWLVLLVALVLLLDPLRLWSVSERASDTALGMLLTSLLVLLGLLSAERLVKRSGGGDGGG